MHALPASRSGLQRLINIHRRRFRTAENLNHYSPRDLERAERCDVKFALGAVRSQTELRLPR